MQILYTFLELAFHLVRGLVVRVTKKMYRNCAVLLSGLSVATVLSFSTNAYAGAGRTAAVRSGSRGGEIAAEAEASYDEPAELSEDSLTLFLGAENTDSAEEGRKHLGNFIEVREGEKLENTEKYQAAIAEKVSARKEQEAIEAEKQARKERAVIPYDDYDLECLERIVQAEAGGQDEEGRILVADVIINRVRSSQFPNDVYDVIYQKGQFQPVSSGVIDRVTVTDTTRDCVERALEGEDYSQGALYFMNREESTRVNKTWFDGSLTYVMSHGGHEFYR